MFKYALFRPKRNQPKQKVIDKISTLHEYFPEKLDSRRKVLQLLTQNFDYPVYYYYYSYWYNLEKHKYDWILYPDHPTTDAESVINQLVTDHICPPDYGLIANHMMNIHQPGRLPNVKSSPLLNRKNTISEPLEVLKNNYDNRFSFDDIIDFYSQTDFHGYGFQLTVATPQLASLSLTELIQTFYGHLFSTLADTIREKISETDFAVEQANCLISITALITSLKKHINPNEVSDYNRRQQDLLNHLTKTKALLSGQDSRKPRLGIQIQKPEITVRRLYSELSSRYLNKRTDFESFKEIFTTENLVKQEFKQKNIRIYWQGSRSELATLFHFLEQYHLIIGTGSRRLISKEGLFIHIQEGRRDTSMNITNVAKNDNDTSLREIVRRTASAAGIK